MADDGLRPTPVVLVSLPRLNCRFSFRELVRSDVRELRQIIQQRSCGRQNQREDALQQCGTEGTITAGNRSSIKIPTLEITAGTAVCRSMCATGGVMWGESVFSYQLLLMGERVTVK